MTRPTTFTLAMLALLPLLACGDDGNPGSASDTTPTMPGEAGDDTTTAPVTLPTTGDDEPIDTSEGMTAATTDTPPPACAHDDECPSDPNNPCARAACGDDGACGFAPLAAETPLPDDPGNCLRSECDGDGAARVVPFDDPPNDTPDDCLVPTCKDGAVKQIPADDPPSDTPGDCKATTCDAGEVTFVEDDFDLPDDAVECTQDTCNDGVPAFVPKPANSFCGPNGASFCHDDTSCRFCKQVSEACEDETNTEVNDTQQTAHDFGTISDADSAGDSICPVLKGADDVDWYHYKGDDKFPNIVDPTRVVTSDLNARLCVYFACEGGANTFVGCNADEVADVAPGGQKGCCGVGNVSPTLDCPGTDDAADVWIKVENVDMLACVPYQFDYHF